MLRRTTCIIRQLTERGFSIGAHELHCKLSFYWPPPCLPWWFLIYLPLEFQRLNSEQTADLLIIFLHIYTAPTAIASMDTILAVVSNTRVCKRAKEYFDIALQKQVITVTPILILTHMHVQIANMWHVINWHAPLPHPLLVMAHAHGYFNSNKSTSSEHQQVWQQLKK